MAAVIGAFVGTFVLVCALAYWLLPSRRKRRQPPELPPSPAVKIATSIAIVVVGAGVVLGIIAVMLQLAKWTLFPTMDFVAPRVMGIFLRPGGAAFLAIVVILIGIPLSNRFRRPARVRAGIALIALALITFFPMQYFAASRTMPFPEFKTALHFGALFISLTLFAAGLETMRRSRNTREDDSSEI